MVHGQPRSVFVDPVGYGYPVIKNRTKSLGYKPLPTPAQRPLGVDVPPATQTPTAPAPKMPRKQSQYAPRPAATPASEPAKPTVEIVPRLEQAEGRATTQNRR